jgi:hypothetical protein
VLIFILSTCSLNKRESQKNDISIFVHSIDSFIHPAILSSVQASAPRRFVFSGTCPPGLARSCKVNTESS